MSYQATTEAHRYRYVEGEREERGETESVSVHDRPVRAEPVVTFRHLLSTTFEASNPLRVIAHCDVDAAYAQFEAARLGIDCKNTPLAVLQWTSLIAVNYAARAHGVNRFNCTLEQAKERCPSLQLIHVASYGPGDDTPQYYKNPSSKTHKISLDLYRRESKKIMEIFQRRLLHQSTGTHLGFDLAPVVADCWAPSLLAMQEGSVDDDILFEKASIDESFFDLSVFVRKELMHRFPLLDIRGDAERATAEDRVALLDAPLPPLPLFVKQELVKKSWTLLGAWWPSEQDNVDTTQQASQASDDEAAITDMTWLDVAYSIAAERMIAVRKHIVEQLGYTTSAGIAENKALAKLCSSHRKPCSQTLLLPRYVLDFLEPLPFRKIRFLGGKLGAEVADVWGDSTVGELWPISASEMQNRFGADGRWLYDLFRGVDRSDVSRRTSNRSMMSAKNFQPALASYAKGLHWLSIMSAELSARLQEEREECPLLYPRSLVLRYLVSGTSGARSQQMPFGFVRNEELAKEIYGKAEKLWSQGIGQSLERATGPDRVGIATLSLSFAGLERQSRDQQQLHTFFEPKRKRAPSDEVPEPEREPLPPRTPAEARTEAPTAAPSEAPAEPTYEKVTDHDTQTEMVRWCCRRCDHQASVPMFDDPDEEDAPRRSYEVILDRLRLEHVHWHMALDLAADL